jgi:hypothetical protein
LIDCFYYQLSPQRVGNHDDLAEEIAVAGREWAETSWRAEDMKACESSSSLRAEAILTHYTDMFRLLLEYARVMDPERDARGDQVPPPGHA